MDTIRFNTIKTPLAVLLMFLKAIQGKDVIFLITSPGDNETIAVRFKCSDDMTEALAVLYTSDVEYEVF